MIQQSHSWAYIQRKPWFDRIQDTMNTPVFIAVLFAIKGSIFSTPSPPFIVCGLFDYGHSDWCKMITHCNFDLHFSNNE